MSPFHIEKRVFVEIFQQKHVFSTWNGLTNGWSHVYKVINLVWMNFSNFFIVNLIIASWKPLEFLELSVCLVFIRLEFHCSMISRSGSLEKVENILVRLLNIWTWIECFWVLKLKEITHNRFSDFKFSYSNTKPILYTCAFLTAISAWSLILFWFFFLSIYFSNSYLDFYFRYLNFSLLLLSGVLCLLIYLNFHAPFSFGLIHGLLKKSVIYPASV